MFIAQVMHAEGLVKILKHIQFVSTYQNQTTIRCEAKTLAAIKLKLEMLPWDETVGGIISGVTTRLTFLKKVMKQYSISLSEVQKCGIRPEEYEEKFHLIYSDCLRISHGSVKPPEWRPA